MELFTYGGGEILSYIFNAIAMLFNPTGGGLVRPVMMVTASIGAIIAATNVFFNDSTKAFISAYFLPLLAIGGMLVMPTATVHIRDTITDKSYKVDHVPIFLARFSEMVGSIGYRFTEGIEKAMHLPQNQSYNKTGKVFGSDLSLDVYRYELINGTLEQNLRSACKQCITYDIAQGRYSVDELKKAPNIWEFLSRKTSKVRMVRYRDPEESQQSKYLSCKEAFCAMTPYFEQEKNYYSNLEVCKRIPLTFQALTGIQKSKEELIGQQLMMRFLADEFNPDQFAVSRAQDQQRSTYHIMGSLAANGLIYMRIVLEALIYVSFLFILPMTLLPGGYMALGKWMGLVIWIQLWPPFYAILNYVMQIAGQHYAGGILNTLSESECGLNFFTSRGLRQIQWDVGAMAGYMSASIPFLSYAVLQGGVSSFIHLAGSIMSPAQSAASSASTEISTGNLSYANASLGQTSYHNTSGFQNTTAPTLSEGHFTHHHGPYSKISTDEGSILKQHGSDLFTSHAQETSKSASASYSSQNASTFSTSEQQTFSDATSAVAKNIVDMSEHAAMSSQSMDQYQSREAYDLNNSVRTFTNMAKNWGEQFGLNERKSVELLTGASASAGFKLWGFFGGSASAETKYNQGASHDDVLSSATNYAASDEFQSAFQNVKDAVKSASGSLSKEDGDRYVEGASAAFDELKSLQTQWQKSFNEQDSLSHGNTDAENFSQQDRQNLNQSYWSRLVDQYAGDEMKAYHQMKKIQADSEAESATKTALPTGDRFKEEHARMRSNYTSKEIKKENPGEFYQERSEQLYQMAARKGLHQDQPGEKMNELSHRFEEFQKSYEAQYAEHQQNRDQEKDRVPDLMEESQSRYLISKAAEGPRNLRKGAIGNYGSLGAPLGMRKN